jgi:hypothetical protein
MRSKAFTGAAVVVALALTASATAQNVSLREQTVPAVPSAVSNSVSILPPRNGTPEVEPASMAGMLAAQNIARQRIGLPLLTWSPELAAKAEATVSAEVEGKCNINSAARAAEAEGVAVYWAAGLNRLGGTPSVQGILPSFVVSEWSAARADYDLARHTCRRTGACHQYAKMVSPNAHEVGCAMAICPSKAQVWICRYSDSVPPAAAKAPSTRR